MWGFHLITDNVGRLTIFRTDVEFRRHDLLFPIFGTSLIVASSIFVFLSFGILSHPNPLPVGPENWESLRFG